MGNGALVPSSDRSGGGSGQRYREVERRCAEGYFFQHPADYAIALEQAMLLDYLDCLEVLLVAGDVKRAYAVHMACRLGKIESLEMLLSAGFPGNTKDREEKVPLHHACTNITSEGVLCVSLLAIRYPATAKSFDRAGHTPVHQAVLVDNVAALEVLQEQGIKLSGIKNLNGFSPLDLAKVHKSMGCISFLSGQGKPSARSPSKTKKEEEVSNERIMAVWEKFFENAFMRAGLDMDDEDDDGYDPFYSAKHRADYKNNNNDNNRRATGHTRSASKNENELYTTEYLSSKGNNVLRQDVKDMMSSTVDEYLNDDNNSEKDYVEDWLDQVALLYEDQEYGMPPSYVLLHRRTKLQTWLQVYLEELYYTGHTYWFLHEEAGIIAGWALPLSFYELIMQGWVVYYDKDSQYCSWFNLVSGVKENYLPLMMTETIENVEYYGLRPYDHGDGSAIVWVEADQYIAQSWVCVVRGEWQSLSEYEVADHDDGKEYYYNTVTGDTSWDPPLCWEILLQRWNGWMLCCMEMNTLQQFWFDPVTAESQWIEL